MPRGEEWRRLVQRARAKQAAQRRNQRGKRPDPMNSATHIIRHPREEGTDGQRPENDHQ